MVGTIMPLTSYASGKATAIFQLGFALSNLLGAVTSKLFKPLLNLMTFQSLDQSPWNHVGISDPNDGTNNGDGNTNENEIDGEATIEIELDPSINSDHEQELTIESNSENEDEDDNSDNKKN